MMRNEISRNDLVLAPLFSPIMGGKWGRGKGGFQCRPKVSAVVDEQGQTPERRPINCDISVRGLRVICVTF